MNASYTQEIKDEGKKINTEYKRKQTNEPNWRQEGDQTQVALSGIVGLYLFKLKSKSVNDYCSIRGGFFLRHRN